MEQFEQVQILIDRLEDLLPTLKERDIQLDYDAEFAHDLDGNPDVLDAAELSR
ncbi:hypothetical protein D3C80_2241720 [compost metagenome]